MLLSALTLTVFVAACTGGGETAGIDRGGVRTPVAVSGPITAFGSIFVNGVRFDIAAAQIDVNGATATEQDLAIGQIVQVDGEVFGDGAQGEAATVAFESNVTGIVEAVDAAASTITVLGQAVDVSDAVLDLDGRPSDTGSILAGDRVEVSGHVSADGKIVGTRVALDDAGELRVRGAVEALDTVASRFLINDLTVDFASAALIEGFAGGAPAAGDVIVAVGSTLGSDGALLASRLRLYEPVSGQAGGETEVEDLITRFVSAADFDVGGRAARATAATDYEGGDVTDLALNVKVQVEGRFDLMGVIEATKIEIKDGGRVQSGD
jgi:hypothetical protein